MRVTSCRASHTSCRKVFGFFGGIRFCPKKSFLLSRSVWTPARPGIRKKDFYVLHKITQKNREKYTSSIYMQEHIALSTYTRLRHSYYCNEFYINYLYIIYGEHYSNKQHSFIFTSEPINFFMWALLKKMYCIYVISAFLLLSFSLNAKKAFLITSLNHVGFLYNSAQEMRALCFDLIHLLIHNKPLYINIFCSFIWRTSYLLEAQFTFRILSRKLFLYCPNGKRVIYIMCCALARAAAELCNTKHYQK